MQFTEEEFEAIRQAAEDAYRKVERVRCPYFSDNVHFNAKGIEHLKFKEKNKARVREDQYVRFRLLKIAPEVIRLSKTVQGKSEQHVPEAVRSNGRTETRILLAVYHEFIAIIDGIRVRVIVKQVSGGPHYFWSIVPFWKNDATHGKRMHYGRPEHD
jgi:hypothetical protein